MAGLTLDSGPLIAVDKGDSAAWAALQRHARLGTRITIPAVVLAQSWRSDRNARLGLLVRWCVVEPLTEAAARRLLCAAAHFEDIVDAAVVVSALSRGDEILTSDPTDIERLVGHTGESLRVVDLARLRQ